MPEVRFSGGDATEVPGGVVVAAGGPVRVEVPADAGAFYRHGWQSWSETRWLDPGQAPARHPVPERWPFVDDPAHVQRRVHGGSGLGAVEVGDGQVLLLGSLGLGGRVELDGAALTGSCEGGPSDWFVAQGPEAEVFERYADLLGERLGRRRRLRTPRIWCSWYAFVGKISESRLLRVLDSLDGLELDVFQVDDGWQRAIGDWRANDRFASGMGDLAGRIGDAGLTPGLWLAPFVVRADTDLARDRPELFVRDDTGAPVFAGHNWGGDCLALDLTHPGAQEWVADLVTATVAAGYRFLKLDFLCAAALPGHRHEDLPRELAYRQGVELVRRAAGDDVYLLACGAPVIASLGVFDGLRVGPDVAPWWEMEPITRYLHDVAGPNARYAVATSLHRLWLRSLIDTDPDVAYFRARHNLLSRSQRALVQDLARVAGVRGTSDPPAWLDDDERAALATFLTDEPEVVRLGRHRYSIDGREVDFGPVADAPPEYLPWTTPDEG